jgi:hypothetical protein
MVLASDAVANWRNSEPSIQWNKIKYEKYPAKFSLSAVISKNYPDKYSP